MIEEIIETFDNLQFYDENLQLKEDKWREILETKEQSLTEALYVETYFVNKFLTVQRCIQYEDNHVNSSFFKRNIFYKTITNPNLPRNENGIIEKFGMYMSKEEFANFKEAYNQLFIYE